jgi:RNase P subunit RPR2
MTATPIDLQDDADWIAPRRAVCAGCHRPITAKQASIHSGTSKGREHWHISCCPWLRKAPAEISGDSP